MTHKTTRRGILLLLILALLAMFGMVAVAFVVLSNQTLRSTKALQSHEKVYYPPQNDLNEAMMQVIRGTVNPVSKLAAHSLLEDMYGNPQAPLVGSIVSAAPVCGGQLIQITTTLPDADLLRHVGSVITFTTNSGAAYGLSTRILSISPATPTPSPLPVQILAFSNAAIPPNNSNFIINGMPFTGTGNGYNPRTGRLDVYYAFNNNNNAQRFELKSVLTPQHYPAFPVALLPYLPLSTYSNPLTNPDNIPVPQVNEDYDAADYQNTLLATPPLSTGGIPRIIPSMHRPALVNYWYQQLFNTVLPPMDGNFSTMTPEQKWYAILHPYGYDNIRPFAPGDTGDNPKFKNITTGDFIVAFKRNIIGRPLPEDHPQFNGSNPMSRNNPVPPLVMGQLPYFWERDGQHWDVDTDGNGIPDANWIDIGLPIRTTPDGRKYKPLVAIYCLDMDGRLNLNAHGNLAQANTVVYTAQVNAGTNSRFAPIPVTGFVQRDTLVRGQGAGPAEINLAPLFTTAPADYQKILNGAGGIEGRFGQDGIPGSLNQNYLGFNKYFNLPDNYTTAMGGYGSPIDLKGTMAIGLDPRGQPLYQDALIPATTSMQSILLPDPNVTGSAANPYLGQLFTTNPYALNLSPKTDKGLPSPSTTVNDNPFSVAELERILRPYDHDATTLPARLQQLASYLVDSRHLITTESHDLPCQVAPKVLNSWRGTVTAPLTFYPEYDLNDTSGAVTPAQKDWIRTWYPLRSIVDLLTARYYNNARTANNDVATSMNMANTAVANNARKLFPRELLAGLKMNLNRPLPTQGTTNIQLYTQPGGTPANIPIFYNPDGQTPLIDPTSGNPIPDTVIPLSQQSRQLHARHLYVLMMLLREAGVVQFFNEPGLSTAQKEQLTTRRIAQWAINAVDFMTGDSVMTPFEYDENPFTQLGWRVDGRIGNSDYPSADDGLPYRGLVWGCKPPDLLLMENVNFHDRRVADTNMDPSNKMRQDIEKMPKPHPADPTLDQPEMPQGSTFLELYCTRNDTNPQAPEDLYYYDNGLHKWFLDLGRRAPAWVDANYRARFNNQALPDYLKRQYPVWRLVVGETNDQHTTTNDARAQLMARPETYTPQTQQRRGFEGLPTSILSPPTSAPVTIDRIVWFTNAVTPVTQAADPSSYHADAERIYYYRQGSNLLPGGEYLVVGPRAVTNIGYKFVNKKGPISSTYNHWGVPSPQIINLNPVGYITSGNLNRYPDTTTQIKTPRTMIVAADPPSTWVDRTQRIGLNVSEPIPGLGNYYLEPTFTYKGVKDWYGNPESAATRTFQKPQDSVAGRPLTEDIANTNPPQNRLRSATYINYKTFFLQRLANPREPFEPMTNPYITVDWQPADLTVFNGMDYMSKLDWKMLWTGNQATPPGAWDPEDPDVGENDPFFASRQRGYDAATDTTSFWLPGTLPPAESTKNATATNIVFKYDLNHSLGYLNLPYWHDLATWNSNWKTWDGTTPSPAWTTCGTDPAIQPWITSAVYDAATKAVPNPPVPQYYGDPLTPRPWLTWNNRPYLNSLELLLVPSSDPGRLLSENLLTTGSNPYTPTSTGDVPFPSRLDFFMSASPEPGIYSYPPSLYRIFDYLHVPSPFVDAETQGNPTTMAGGAHLFYPPFHQIPNYRETGKINLNTIYDNQVFTGLMNNFPANWQTFVQSRRGYGPLNDNITQIDPTVPTEFARPFRSSANASLTPPTVPAASAAYDREISATILRASPNPGNPKTTNTVPLFQYTSTNPAQDTSRNPYFRYLGIERLDNLTTTRSNVYAVWITVGYFEVTPVNNVTKPWLTPAQFQQVYPEGYQLGQELGSDTGEIVRHRAFYMFDRSIPVGFERGQDLNVEKAILLKRYIE